MVVKLAMLKGFLDYGFETSFTDFRRISGCMVLIL
jgi:hypothetical protein